MSSYAVDSLNLGAHFRCRSRVCRTWFSWWSEEKTAGRSQPDSGPASDDQRARRAAWPGRPFVDKIIGQIDVKGLKRIEKDAVIAKLTSKVGNKLTADDIRSDIQAVFAMGYFDEIEILADRLPDDKVKVIVQVRERPVISKIEFEGNERISTSDLQDVIKVKQWYILDVNKVKEDVGLIQKHYEDKGFYLAKVNFEVKKTDKPDEVELIYKINDYDKVQIKKITFLNNRRFTDEELKGALAETREGGFLSFVSGSGNFKESSFKTDFSG